MGTKVKSTRENLKRGISLIVLVITIIVMIILAAAIIISLNNNGIINNANEAVNKTDEVQVKTLANMVWSEAYIDKVQGKNDEIYSRVVTNLIEQDIDVTQYQIDITDNGINVEKFDKTKWEYAYTYNRSQDEWKKILSTDDVELSGDIIATFYKTGEIITPNTINFGKYEFTLPAGEGYKVIIEGTGYMNPLMMLDVAGGQNITGGLAWQYDTALVVAGYATTSVVPYITEVVIGNGIENIGDFAFTAASSIKKVIIGKDVKKIGISSFQVCNSLEQINFPITVETIDDFAFSACTSLKNIKFSKNIKSIGNDTFFKCTFESIILPKSISSIHNEAFELCNNLNTIYYEGTQQQWENIAGSDSINFQSINKVYNYKY